MQWDFYFGNVTTRKSPQVVWTVINTCETLLCRCTAVYVLLFSVYKLTSLAFSLELISLLFKRKIILHLAFCKKSGISEDLE